MELRMKLLFYFLVLNNLSHNPEATTEPLTINRPDAITAKLASAYPKIINNKVETPCVRLVGTSTEVKI